MGGKEGRDEGEEDTILSLGRIEGSALGKNEGCSVGATDGSVDGAVVGSFVGITVGDKVIVVYSYDISIPFTP